MELAARRDAAERLCNEIHHRRVQDAQIGGKLDTFASNPHGNAFISSDVAELATRLRQLDCAARAGMSFDVADQRYAQIIAELGVEKSILDPGATDSKSTVGRAIR